MDLRIFDSMEFGSLRTIEKDREILFCASDVATALGYSNISDAISRHCRSVVKHDTVTTQGNSTAMNFIKEGDVFRLITRSKLPAAEKFEIWVFDTVLPQIRKTGGFIPMSETDSDAELMARALLIATKTMELKDARIKNLETAVADNAEKVLLVDSLHLDTSVKIGHLAKTLSIKGLGQNNFFKWLRSEKILLLNNEPTSTYQQHFTLMNHKIDKLGVNKPTTMFKLESLQWLLNRLKRSGYLVNKNYDELMGLLKN